MGRQADRWNKVRANPERALFDFMNDVEKQAEEKTAAAAQGFLNKIAKSWEETLNTLYTDVKRKLAQLADKLAEEGRLMIKRRINELPQIKGDRGEDGRDGKDGKDGRDGETPQPGVHFLSKEETEKQIGKAMADLFSSIEKSGLSADAVKKMVASMFDALPFEKIARGLEKLPEREKVDYHKGLKNTPLIPSESTHRHTLHRGGGAGTGSAVYATDLSDQCDGVNKDFTIPLASRIIMLTGTDSPIVYRNTIDYTVTGTTLTLTAAVPAPNAGATLNLIYVL